MEAKDNSYTLSELSVTQLANRRVVCAANRHMDTDVIVLGARHFDSLMHKTIDMHGYKNHPFEQGFIDQWGIFMNRQEAYTVAKAANQIRRKTGNIDEPTLYSEDLY